MKKWIILMLALLLIGGAVLGAFLLFGNDFYKKTRERLALPTKEISLAFCVGEGEEQLNGFYTTRFEDERAKIVYSFEEFALFEMEDGEYLLPAQRKTTVKGEMIVVDGEILESDANLPPFPVGVITLSSFSFQKEYFENAVITDTSFEADVKDAGALLGLSEDCQGVRIKLSFDEERVRLIMLTYTTLQGRTASLQYTFVY